MTEAIRIATNVGTPLALLGLVVIISYYAYSRYLASQEKKLELLPPEQRAKAIDTYLTRYNMDASNLTRDQKVQLIRDEMQQRHQQSRSKAWIWMVVLAAICFIAACVTYGLGLYWMKSNDQSKASTLLLRMEDEEFAIPAEQAKRGLGPAYYFTLSNPSSGLAMIDGITVEVVDVIDDRWSSTEALVHTYTYEVMLNPDKKAEVPLNRKYQFKYASGEIDRFAVKLSSEKIGHDYFFRFVVKWYDAVLQTKHQTVSDIMVARFPAAPSPDDKLTLDERGRKSEEQSERIQKHLKKLQSDMKDI